MITGLLNTSVPNRVAARVIKTTLVATLIYIGVIYNTKMALVFFLGVVTGALAFTFLSRVIKSE